MNKRTESSQPEQQQEQQNETSQPPPLPTPPLHPPPPSPPPSSPPSGSSSQQQSATQQNTDDLQRQENLKQFNILLTPAFAAFSQIADGLYLTGVGGMSYDNFRKNKITNIINCTHEAPNWRLSGVECCRIPIDDTPTQDLTPYLENGVDKIHSIVSNGGKVVVHCVAGVSRSAAIVIAYLIKYKRMTLHEAFNHVQSCRRVVRPNNGFFNQLIAFEAKILGSNSVRMVKLKRDDVVIEIPDFFEAEHRKFVLMETFKAKANKLKGIAESAPVIQGHQQVPGSGSNISSPNRHRRQPIQPQAQPPPTQTPVQPTVKPSVQSSVQLSVQPPVQSSVQPIVQPPVQPQVQTSVQAFTQSSQSAQSSANQSIKPTYRTASRSPVRTKSRLRARTSRSPARSVRSPPPSTPHKTPSQAQLQTQSQSESQTRPPSQPPSQQ